MIKTGGHGSNGLMGREASQETTDVRCLGNKDLNRILAEEAARGRQMEEILWREEVGLGKSMTEHASVVKRRKGNNETAQ